MINHVVIFHLCTKEELLSAMELHNSNPWYGRDICRGFYILHEEQHHVYALNKCAGFLPLLSHELAHSLKMGHTWFPGIRNFSGLFRWFAFDLYDIRRVFKK